MNTPALPPLALIAGPTASGKSALALKLAEARGGIVINADSAQVYRDLRVVTARPTVEEEAHVPHRLFGHVDGAETYSAAQWAGEARLVIEMAQTAGRLPILVGGTGLYLRTLLDGIAPIPSIDPAIRAEARALPVEQAHRALVLEDPAAAARLNAADTTRIARALEVVRSTGRPLAEWQRAREGGIGGRVSLQPMILLPDRAALWARIDRRLDRMIANGALEEVRALLDRADIPENAPVRRAIGVPEFAGWLTGRLDRDEALAAARAATRRYAKRQYTWFRRQPPDEWPRIAAFGEETTIDEMRLAAKDRA